MPVEFRQFLRLLEPDNLFLPKQVMKCRYISDQSKIMLGIIFTKNRFESVDTVKQALANVSFDDVANEFGNADKRTINRIMSDVKRVASDFDDIFSDVLGGEKCANQ